MYKYDAFTKHWIQKIYEICYSRNNNAPNFLFFIILLKYKNVRLVERVSKVDLIFLQIKMIYLMI